MTKTLLPLLTLTLLLTLGGCRHNNESHIVAEQSVAEQIVQTTLHLDGVANGRDLGGYPAAGKHIKKGLLLRSSNLSKASDGAIATLEQQYALCRVFDFRTTEEHNAAPDKKVRGCINLWLPCMEGMFPENTNKKMFKTGSVDDIADGLLAMSKDTAVAAFSKRMYPTIVFDTTIQKRYAIFLDSVAAAPEGHAILWHCSQGKDRAGWATAFLLAALGAERDVIVADFAFTNDNYHAMIDKAMEKAKAQGYSTSAMQTVKALVGVDVGSFKSTLDEIEHRYGSLDNYLVEALHCDHAQMELLRAKYLE